VARTVEGVISDGFAPVSAGFFAIDSVVFELIWRDYANIDLKP